MRWARRWPMPSLRCSSRSGALVPLSPRDTVQELRPTDTDAQLLDRARALNTVSLGESGTKAPLRLLQRKLGIGQRRAQRIQALLPDTLPASADAQPSAKEA